MAGKLKGIDPKGIAVNHGEKIAFGVIVILVILGFVSTNWVPYDKDPNAITADVAAARAKLESAGWPETDREKFALTADEQPHQYVLARLEDNIDEKHFWLSQRMTKSLYDLDKPLQRPVYRRVEDMIATQSRVFVQLPPEDELLVDDENAEGAAVTEVADAGTDANEFVPDEFLESATGGGLSAGSPYGAMGGDMYDDSMASLEYDSMYAPELMETGGAEGMDMYGGAGYEGMRGEGEVGGPTRNLNGRGYSFVSVRGIFEYQLQIREYSEATRKPLQEAVRHFEIIDNQIERKTLLVAPDTWSDWQPVNGLVLRDVLNSAQGLAADPVSSAVTDTAITCPLPQRIFGRWETQAMHPRLGKEFVLSDEALKKEMEFNRALLTTFMKEEETLPETVVQKKGFNDLLFDRRQLTQSLFGLDSPYSSMMMGEEGYGDDYGSGMGGMAAMRGMSGMQGFGGARGGPAENPALRELAKKLANEMELDDQQRDAKLQDWIIEQAKPEGSVLLFRYIDFDVEPGRTYKYRVRLELRNPNYKQPLGAAGGDPSVVTEPTHWTPWSDETPAITVDDTVNYYLTRVERPRVHLYPEAQMNLFQYDTDLGTTVQQQVRVPLGAHVGGDAVAKQANPAKGTFEDADYTFHSDDVLVDCLLDPQFNSREHPDLQLPRDSRGNAHVNEMALVVTADHRFKILDPTRDATAESRMMTYIEKQEEFFEDLKAKKPAAGAFGEGAEYDDIYSGIYGDESTGGYGDMMGGMMGGEGGRNFLRRGRGGSTRGRGRGRGGAAPGYE